MTESRRWLPLGLLTALAVTLWLLRPDDPDAAPRVESSSEEGAAGDPGAYAPGARALERTRRAAGPPSPAETAIEAPRGPHGRVVIEGGRGLAALDVDLWVGERRAATTRTSRSGAFALPRPRGAPAEVRVRPDPRLHLDRPARRLLPAQARGDQAILFEGRAAGRSPFHGRLVDARTGEPLPYFGFLCFDTIGTDDHVETDAQGDFRTVQPYGLGRIRLWMNDFEGSLGRYGPTDHERLDLDEESVVEVRVGPTYRLRFQPPAGTVVTDFLAEVRDHRRAPRWYPGLFQRSRLRPGDPIWVRLHPDEVTEGPGPPWLLAIESEDGLWAGEVEVEARVGRQPDVLPLTVVSRGAVRGRIEGRGGRAVACPLRIEQSDGREVWTHSDGEGGFVLRALTPGEARLVVEAEGHEHHQQILRVERGEETHVVLRLRPIPTAGALAGTLRTDSGGALEGLHIELISGTRRRYAPVQWLGHEPALGTFRIELEAGEWSARPMGEAFGLRASPDERTASPPTEDLTFVLHDQVARVDWVLRALDEEQRPLAGARAWLRDAQGRRVFEGPLPAEGPLLRDFPADAAFTWSVLAPGRRLVHGDATDFVDAGDSSRQRLALARPAPGWGAVLAVLEDGSAAPIPGVELSLDGATLGPSDERGHLHVDLDRAPTQLAVRTPGWRLAHDNQRVDPVTGLFAAGDGGWSIGILLERVR